MRYYPTVGDYDKVVSTVKYTLQDQFFRGSFTQEVLSKGKVVFYLTQKFYIH